MSFNSLNNTTSDVIRALHETDKLVSKLQNRNKEMTSRLVSKAEVFATIAHADIDHMRKYSNDPYIVHPIRVAATVKEFGGTDDMIASAFLHDTVEDTKATMEDIVMQFGEKVAVIVEGLTDVSVPTDGNRAVRKAIDRVHSADATYEAQFVKCADIIDNSADIGENDPDFNIVYKKEMALLLTVLDKVKDTPIYKKALDSVTKYM